MRRRPFTAVLAAACLTLALVGASPAPVGAAPGANDAESDVLDAPRHGEDAIRRLGANSSIAAARNDQTVAQLHAKLRADSSYYVDKKGRLVVHDTGLLAGGTGSSGPAASPAAPFPYAQTFELHSGPGASRVIYLDFDGHDVAGTAWNANYTGGAPVTAAAYDTDGLPTFSSAEQDVVQSVWQRVSEDYSAFDVDVTTQDPGAEAITRSGSSDLAFGTRVVITNTTSVYSACSCGGTAYVGTYDIPSKHADYQPAFVFQRGTGAGAHNIAEAASHEVGHNLGLSHDGTATTPDYYTGHGEWAPIMGAGYYEPVTQWSKGEYSGANNKEDDWAVMQSNGAPLRADDHGNSAATATALTGPALSAVGRINSSTDTDWFSFNTTAGTVSLAVSPAPVSPDLDASLAVFDAGGTQVGFADPVAAQVSGDVASGLDATLSLVLASGAYSVRVDGVGKGTPSTGYSDYASVGTFTLTGILPLTPPPAAPSGVSAAVGSGRTVTVQWTDNSSNETSFTVLREQRKNGTWSSPAVVATTAANATSQTNSPGRGTFRYSVRANNGGGSSADVKSNTVKT